MEYPTHWQPLIDLNPTMWLRASMDCQGNVSHATIDQVAPTPREVTYGTMFHDDSVAIFGFVNNVWCYVETPDQSIAHLPQFNLVDINNQVNDFLTEIAEL